MNKAILILDLCMLICLFLYNHELDCKIIELEERIKKMERQSRDEKRVEIYDLWQTERSRR